MTTNTLSPELVSPFDELDKRYIDGKIVNVTYHQTDWWKFFRPNISYETLANAVYGYCLNHSRTGYFAALYAVKRMSDREIINYAELYKDYKRSNYS